MILDPQIKELFDTVERYVMPLIGGDSPSGFSKQENKVLALQNINRLNISLGKIARLSKDESGNLHILQMYINNLTVALKNDNIPMMKSSIASSRNLIKEIEKTA
jgi:hypothetical protein